MTTAKVDTVTGLVWYVNDAWETSLEEAEAEAGGARDTSTAPPPPLLCCNVFLRIRVGPLR